jgi:hypothetical protein
MTKNMNSGEDPTAEGSAYFQEGPGDHAETLGRLSLSFPGKRARIAMLEHETHNALIDRAIESNNLVDWMPNINNNEPMPVVTDHMG